MTTDQKGAIAEAAIVCEALKMGVDVYKPVAEGGRCDLIFDLASRLIRVQCKSATRRGEVVVVQCRSCRRSREGFIRRCYGRDEIDAFAAYCPEINQCYFLPIDRFAERTAIQLRLAPTLNNQQRGINWASNFEFAATLGPA